LSARHSLESAERTSALRTTRGFAMSSSAATDALSYALKKVEEEFKDLPDGDEMIEKITSKFVATSNDPPRLDFEFVMQRPFTNDEVCVALFRPDQEQISYFALLLAAAQETPIGHPLTRTCPLLVSLIFLVHS